MDVRRWCVNKQRMGKQGVTYGANFARTQTLWYSVENYLLGGCNRHVRFERQFQAATQGRGRSTLHGGWGDHELRHPWCRLPAGHRGPGAPDRICRSSRRRPGSLNGKILLCKIAKIILKIWLILLRNAKSWLIGRFSFFGFSCFCRHFPKSIKQSLLCIWRDFRTMFFVRRKIIIIFVLL